MSIKIRELYSYLDSIIPTSLSCDWDNDGLMVCGDVNADVKKILLTLDVTDGALEYAEEHGCNVIISHHPMIFRPVKSVVPTDVTSTQIIKALRSDISVMSFHTRLDAVKDGVNDVLCEILGVVETEIFGPAGEEIGRIGVVDTIDFAEFAYAVKDRLGADSLTVTDAGKKTVNRVAVLGGGGKDFVTSAFFAGADTFVTGEINYNTAVIAKDLGINVIEAGHYYTEAPVLHRLVEWIENRFAGLSFEFYKSNPSKTI